MSTSLKCLPDGCMLPSYNSDWGLMNFFWRSMHRVPNLLQASAVSIVVEASELLTPEESAKERSLRIAATEKKLHGWTSYKSSKNTKAQLEQHYIYICIYIMPPAWTFSCCVCHAYPMDSNTTSSSMLPAVRVARSTWALLTSLSNDLLSMGRTCDGPT